MFGLYINIQRTLFVLPMEWNGMANLFSVDYIVNQHVWSNLLLKHWDRLGATLPSLVEQTCIGS